MWIQKSRFSECKLKIKTANTHLFAARYACSFAINDIHTKDSRKVRYENVMLMLPALLCYFFQRSYYRDWYACPIGVRAHNYPIWRTQCQVMGQLWDPMSRYSNFSRKIWITLIGKSSLTVKSWNSRRLTWVKTSACAMMYSLMLSEREREIKKIAKEERESAHRREREKKRYRER